MWCKKCQWEIQEPDIIPRPDTPHAGEMRCPTCQSFLGWVKKEKNEGKRGPRKYSPSDLNIDYCQLCRIKQINLGDQETLDIHHLDGDPENNERLNFLVLCTSCHKLIHHQITYRNHFIEKQYRLYEEFKKKIIHICPTNFDYEEIIKIYIDLYGI
jgi:hypothetical protein